LGAVPLDREAIDEILDFPQVQIFDAAHRDEHSLEVQLPFLQYVLEDFSLVPLSVGDAEPEEVGEVIEAQTTDPGSLTDFPAWAKTSGNEIVKTDQADKLITFFIKRLA